MRRPNQTWRWPEWLVCSEAELQKLTRLLSHNEQPVWQAGAEVERWFDKLAGLLEEGCDPSDGESRLKLAINGLLLAVLEMLEREHIPLDEYLSTTERAVQMFLAPCRSTRPQTGTWRQWPTSAACRAASSPSTAASSRI